jgi:hypothetical protein
LAPPRLIQKGWCCHCSARNAIHWNSSLKHAAPEDLTPRHVDRPQKITFGEMRDMGVRGLLVYCTVYLCSHSIAISADYWPDDLRH